MEALAFLLRKKGIVAQGLSSAEQFFEVDLALKAALVFDLNPPLLDGVELVRRVRTAGFLHQVVVITADADARVKTAVLGAGADHVLLKPFPSGVLAALFESGSCGD